jgi:hypothetical protein
MGNEKQDGSNLLSLEATTGRCKVFCELCFVNLGQQGFTVPLNILHPWKAKAWYDEAKQKGWKAPPKDPTPEEVVVEDGKEIPLWRLGLANVASATMIPKTTKSAKPSRRRKLIKCNDGSMLPAILRVSSMSDSSLSPRPWLENVRDMWGGYCFFNSNIRAVGRHPEMLQEVFHKVVVTMNGGYQKLAKPTPKVGMEYAEGEIARRLKLPEGYKFGIDTKRDILGSMGAAADEDADFLNPLSLSDIDLADYEDLIKFYRLRVCPTIWPDPHTDRPVVCTVLRFKGLGLLLEFARRYKLHAEVLTNSPAAKKEAAIFEVPVSPARSDGRTRARIWTDKDDDRNDSEYAGEASEYIWEGSFMRPENKELLDEWPYVCDRLSHSCKACGLCATVDGTDAGGVSGVMAEYGLFPESWQTGYVMDEGAPSDEWFGELLEEAAGASEDGFVKNPADEVDLDWVSAALQELARYNLQGESSKNYCVEGWNTHEDVLNLTAYCYWVLLRAGRRAGLSGPDAIAAAHDFVDGATGGINFMWDARELELMWGDDGPWVEQFGSTR